MHADTVPGIVDTRGIVVPVPHEGHDERRLAEVEGFVEAVIAAMLDHDLAVGDDGRLRVPGRQVDVVRRVLVLVEVVADVHQYAVGGLGEHADHALDEVDVRHAETAEAEVHQRLVVVRAEARCLVGLCLFAHAAVQVDELGRVERVAA